MKSLILLLPLLLIGCSDKPAETYWGAPTRHEAPLTEEQIAQVAAHAVKVLEAMPRSLTGDDHIGEDTIRQAHIDARALYSPMVQFEYHRPAGEDWSNKTGRWRYVEPSVEGVR